MHKSVDKIYSYTKALCNKCKKIVDALIKEIDGGIYLEKLCKSHGISHALICSDVQWYQESMFYVKPGSAPRERSVKEFKGCPESCGLCPEHQQHTCLPVVEITNHCNLNCPICLKNPQEPFQMSLGEYEKVLDRLLECEHNVHVINLSGGEPTIHPGFEGFLEVSSEKNIMQTTVSTNGVKLLHDRKLRSLFKKTGTIAALQFDGFLPQTYMFLRGKDLTKQKLEIINILDNEGIKYSLVATVMKHVNDHEITDIVDFFFQSNALSLMFQTAAFTGNAARLAVNKDRITIPDVVKEVEKSNYLKKGNFNPLPCSHFSCFALSYYLLVEKDKYLSLKEFLGKDKYLEVISNLTLPGLDKEGFSAIKESIYEFWSADDTSNTSEVVLRRIRKIIKRLNASDFSPKQAFDLGAENMKAIFIHQFMDFHTLDLGRLIKCCNHYPQVDGRLVPMCAQNVFFQ